MNIWLLTIGEPIIYENQTLRLHRTGLLAKQIAKSGKSEVTWFTSTFNHFTKKHEFEDDEVYQPQKNLKIVALKGRGYKKNISIDRIIDHRNITKKFKKFSKSLQKPDIIVASYPTRGLCKAAIDYGLKNNVKVFIDYRDLWPEVFIDIVPAPFKFIFNFLFKPLFYQRKYIFKNATGLISITDEILNQALVIAERKKNKYDGFFPLGYFKARHSTNEINNAKAFWDNIIQKNSEVNICFFGTFGQQFDFDTIIKAAEILKNSNVNFYLCGSGDKLNTLIKNSKHLKNVYYPGYMSSSQIQILLDRSHIGICPYIAKKAFLSSIPGKAIEYFSNGLPVLTTLGEGVLGQLVANENFGLNYEQNNPISLAKSIEKLIVLIDNKTINRNKIIEFYTRNFDSNIVYKNYHNFLINKF
jgi:glycosyltransferase involved in cell wall biosynthesis